MKIIHTADVHLDSPMAGVDGKTRRRELVTAFSSMAQYADNVGAGAVVVAGDLFDDKFVSEATVKSVADVINGSKARWFVLMGNHGDETPYRKLSQMAKINTFGRDWTRYDVDNVTICGKELSASDVGNFAPLPLEKGRFNLVTLHGDVDSDAYGHIDKKTLSACPINYVALGHRHRLETFSFGKVKACYSGALEPRGFDEGPDGGFVVIDTDSGEIKFVKQSVRAVITKTVDVTSATSEIALERLISDAVSDVSARTYLNLIFTGSSDADLRVEFVARQMLDGKFFALRIQNDVTTRRNMDEILGEVSLRGEFARLALEIEDKKLQSEVLELGLKFLEGGQP